MGKIKYSIMQLEETETWLTGRKIQESGERASPDPNK
jgi:hypothetical protein